MLAPGAAPAVAPRSAAPVDSPAFSTGLAPSPPHSGAGHMSTPSKQPAQAPARPRGGYDRDDDVLHVPQGVSRRTYYFLIGLVILLMLIWLVPGAISSIASGSKNPVVARVQLPNGGTEEWRGTELTIEHRVLKDALEVDQLLAFQMGIDMRTNDTRPLTRIVVLDRIAEDAGLVVTDADLAAHLRQQLGMFGQTDDDFQKTVRARGFDQTAVEEAIRRVLRVYRFEQLIGFAGAVPDPAEIEKMWHRDNEEFAFDYVTAPVADFQSAARAQLPDDAGLQAWFDKLSDAEKQEFKTPEKRRAELALYRDSETTPANELLAAYPEKPPEGGQPTALEELAHQYYDRVMQTRFAKEPGAGEGSSQEGFAGVFSFQEVHEACLTEAPVYFALQRWIDDVNARRTNGETIDLAAEAQKLGLEHQPLEPSSREEIDKVEGADIADDVFATSPDGSLFNTPIAHKGGIAVVRVSERVEPVAQPFADVRERVIEKWLGPKSEELALASLKSLREGFERFEVKDEDEAAPAQKKKPVHYRATGDAFRSAAQTAELEVKTRDYLNKSNRDKQPDDPEQRVLFQQAGTFGLYNLKDDEVAAPGLAADKKTAYLVRLAGKRPVPIENMTPSQYENYKRGARQQAMSDVGRRMDFDFLRKNYGLWLLDDERKAADAAAKKTG